MSSHFSKLLCIATVLMLTFGCSKTEDAPAVEIEKPKPKVEPPKPNLTPARPAPKMITDQDIDALYMKLAESVSTKNAKAVCDLMDDSLQFVQMINDGKTLSKLTLNKLQYCQTIEKYFTTLKGVPYDPRFFVQGIKIHEGGKYADIEVFLLQWIRIKNEQPRGFAQSIRAYMVGDAAKISSVSVRDMTELEAKKLWQQVKAEMANAKQKPQ